MPTYVTGALTVNSFIAPPAFDDTYPTHKPIFGLGGIRTVGTTTEMEAIYDSRREEGMIVYVSGVTAYYALIGTTANSGWTTGFTMGNGGGGGTPFDSSTSYTWTAPQYFSAGFSAAGGVTFTSLTHFTAGLSAAGATFGTLVVNNGISAAGGITFGDKLWVSGGITAGSLSQFGSLFVSGGQIFVSGGLEVNDGGVTFSGSVTPNFYGGLSASGATLGTLVVNSGISASGATFANNVHVGGTLSVNGNFYVAGTMTTVNESQLLIQDKYLVLGSTLGSMAEYGTSAGIYIGTTTAPIASFAYNYNSGTNSHWVSNIPLYVGANEVLTRGNISTATGITADRINMTTASDNTNFRVPFTLVNTPGFARNLFLDSDESGSMLYNPSTNILTVTQIEAIVDGGTW